MKKTVKSLLLMALALVMLLAMPGCSETRQAEKALDSFLGSIKALDFEEFENYAESKNLFNENSALFAEQLFGRMEYEIIDSTKIDSDKFNVKVAITNVDMKPVLKAFFAEALIYAISVNEEEDYTPTAEEVEKKYKAILTKCLKKDNLATVTTDVEVEVVKVDGDWKVGIENELVDAMLGGLSKAAREVKNSK